ncbi:methionine ABC transporter ATP-binding protein, partial [Streptomyces sp. 549]|nr:methionine ABC transporter ATP-binding protein [Streptomyces sp. 549]
MREATTVDRSDEHRNPSQDPPLLDVRDLHVEFHTRDGVVKAVNGVDYS